MRLVTGLLGTVIIGGSFFGLGYAIFTGHPLTDHQITYGGIDPINVQDWIIAQLGQKITGLTFMVIGVYAALWSFFPYRTSQMMKIAGLIGLGLAGLIIYYGYSMYHDIPIELGDDLYGRKQGLQQLFIKVIESIQESLGSKPAGILFMGLGGIWGLLSINAGIFKRPKPDEIAD